MIRLVLFDIDGTLIRTGGAGERAFGRVAATVFGKPNGTAQLNFAGRTDPSIVRDFFTQHRIEPSEENFQRFFERYVFWLDHLLGQSGGQVLPGVREALATLRALPEPPRLGLLTGNIRLGAEIKLRHFGLWEHFEFGGFGDDHEDRSQIACRARERGALLLGRLPAGEEILVVGDTPLDVACARAIQAKTLAVSTGIFPLDQLQAHHPTWAVPNLAQVNWSALCA